MHHTPSLLGAVALTGGVMLAGALWHERRHWAASLRRFWRTLAA
jgi:hypothetical protein